MTLSRLAGIGESEKDGVTKMGVEVYLGLGTAPSLYDLLVWTCATPRGHPRPRSPFATAVLIQRMRAYGVVDIVFALAFESPIP